MRIGRKTRTGLGLSLGILAGIAMILLPGFLNVTQSPFLATHGFANGNNHPSNSTVTTTPRTSQTNSTGTATTNPTVAMNSNSSVAQEHKSGLNGTQLTKTPPGSIPSGFAIAGSTSSIAAIAIALAMLVSTIMVPALALSFLARRWSIRKANKALEDSVP